METKDKTTDQASAEQQKRELRKRLKEKRDSLDERYKKEADHAIFERAAALPQYRTAKTVFCYVGTSDEINTRPLLEHILSEGKRLGVPRCIKKGVMEVRAVTALSQLKPGMYGILEPGEDCPVILPREIDMAFVPCLSCSRDGMRLGYGGGYYDRYLAQTECVKAALCREKMMTEEIPAQEWDLKMDMVITEGVLRQQSSHDGCLTSI